MSYQFLNSILSDYLAHTPIKTVIATDASQSVERCGIGIFYPTLDWSFFLRLPDFMPIFAAELLAVILALQKLTSSTSSAVILTNFLSVCSSLSGNEESHVLSALKSLIPPHINFIKLVWHPGHKGLFLNEITVL